MKIIDAKLKFNGTFKRDNKPEIALIHHALHDNCDIWDVHGWHLAKDWMGFGYHAFIPKAGGIYKGRPTYMHGAHCKENNMNYKSIGICLEGCYTDYLDMTEKTVPAAQIKSLVEYLHFLNLPFEYHRKYATYKDCPGKYFLTEKELKREMNQEDKSCEEILKDSNLDDLKEWIEFFDGLVKMAELKGDIGFLEKAKYLPHLIIKVYNAARGN